MQHDGYVLEHDGYVLEMKKISKSFHKNRVLADIDLSVRPGEIHALLGENGAGKSTLMNILFSMPVIHATGGYEGGIVFDGRPIRLASPMEAMGLGIGMVHQEFMLVPEFSVTENVKLNREITRHNPLSRLLGDGLKTLDMEKMGADTRAALDRLHMSDIDEWARVAGLPVGYKQFIEIAREIDKRNVKLLVFDEPTAVLTEGEAGHLLAAMRELADSGIAILFITHRLDEVMTVADNVTVLRDGQVAGRRSKIETSVYELAELMVGRRIEKMASTRTHAAAGGQIVSLRSFHVHMPGEEVRGLDLDIMEGEIFGIGGLAGQGKVGIANGVMGMYPASGSVSVAGKPLALNHPAAALALDIAFVSEDRRGLGLLLDLSIEMNIAVPSLQNKGRFVRRYGPLAQIDYRAVRENALEMIRELDIRCTGPNQTVRRLSGGNQQKVCLAKALTFRPRILFASEPTRGIDVGAKRHVLETLIKMNREMGITIVMTSSELAELKSVCDRIAIIDEGRLAGILRPGDDDVQFGLLMGGRRKNNPDGVSA